jgi:hypothetical protein
MELAPVDVACRAGRISGDPVAFDVPSVGSADCPADAAVGGAGVDVPTATGLWDVGALVDAMAAVGRGPFAELTLRAATAFSARDVTGCAAMVSGVAETDGATAGTEA